MENSKNDTLITPNIFQLIKQSIDESVSFLRRLFFIKSQFNAYQGFPSVRQGINDDLLKVRRSEENSNAVVGLMIQLELSHQDLK